MEVHKAKRGKHGKNASSDRAAIAEGQNGHRVRIVETLCRRVSRSRPTDKRDHVPVCSRLSNARQSSQLGELQPPFSFPGFE